MYKHMLNVGLFVAIDIMTNISVAYTLELGKGFSNQGNLNRGVQINRQVIMPTPAPPKPAQLPNSEYKLPLTHRNFQPQLTNPARPNIQLNLGNHTSHKAWCQNRYGNYRIMDNSYKDHGGIRQNCISPYGK